MGCALAVTTGNTTGRFTHCGMCVGYAWAMRGLCVGCVCGAGQAAVLANGTLLMNQRTGTVAQLFYTLI